MDWQQVQAEARTVAAEFWAGVLILWAGAERLVVSLQTGFAPFLGTILDGIAAALLWVWSWVLAGWSAASGASPETQLQIVLGILVFYGLVSRVARQVIRRAAAVGLPVVFLLLAGYGWLEPLIRQTATAAGTGGADTSWRVYQAIAAGAIIATGWFVTFAIGEIRAERQRRADQRDLLLALNGEIRYYLFSLKSEDIAEDGKETLDKIDGEGFVPFLPSATQPVVFEALADKMQALPPQVVYKVAAFYSQVCAVRRLTDDLAYERLEKLESAERLRGAYTALLKARLEGENLAVEAARLVNDALGLRPDTGLPTEVVRRVEARGFSNSFEHLSERSASAHSQSTAARREEPSEEHQ